MKDTHLHAWRERIEKRGAEPDGDIPSARGETPPFLPVEYAADFGEEGKLTLNNDSGLSKHVIECKSTPGSYLATYQGYYSPDTANTSGIAKFDSKGIFDTAFGPSSDGTVDFRFGRHSENDQGYVNFQGLCEGADGSLIVWGHFEENRSRSCIVSKLTSDGEVDVSFGTAGHYDLTKGSPGLSVWGALMISVNADHSLNVVGLSDDRADPVYYLLRLTPDGVVDTSFQDQGYLRLNNNRELQFSGIISAGQNGELLIFGSGTETRRSFGFFKLFDREGHELRRFDDLEYDAANGGAVLITSAFIDPNKNSLFICGAVAKGGEDSNQYALLSGYSLEGKPDMHFNNGEPVIHDFGLPLDQWTCARTRQDIDSKILLIGESSDLLPVVEPWSVVGRFNLDGTPDSGFSDERLFRALPDAGAARNEASMVISGPEQLLCAGYYNDRPAVVAVRI